MIAWLKEVHRTYFSASVFVASFLLTCPFQIEYGHAEHGLLPPKSLSLLSHRPQRLQDGHMATCICAPCTLSSRRPSWNEKRWYSPAKSLICTANTSSHRWLALPIDYGPTQEKESTMSIPTCWDTLVISCTFPYKVIPSRPFPCRSNSKIINNFHLTAFRRDYCRLSESAYFIQRAPTIFRLAPSKAISHARSIYGLNYDYPCRVFCVSKALFRHLILYV